MTVYSQQLSTWKNIDQLGARQQLSRETVLLCIAFKSRGLVYVFCLISKRDFLLAASLHFRSKLSRQWKHTWNSACSITVMIRFSAFLPISAPFERIFIDNRFYSNKRPIPISASILISANIRIFKYYSAVRVRINGGSYSLITHIRNAALQKQWSSSEFLNFNVHACA